MSHSKSLKLVARGDREIVITRDFAAPRDLVFEAYTKPELLKRWFGPEGWSLEVCEIDLRVGGSWRYSMRKVSGATMTLRGVYREIEPAERIVSTEIFDDPWYEGEALITTTFVEHGGETTLTITALYASREVRDAVLKTPMESGVASAYDRLAELLASLG